MKFKSSLFKRTNGTRPSYRCAWKKAIHFISTTHTQRYEQSLGTFNDRSSYALPYYCCYYYEIFMGAQHFSKLI